MGREGHAGSSPGLYKEWEAMGDSLCSWWSGWGEVWSGAAAERHVALEGEAGGEFLCGAVSVGVVWWCWCGEGRLCGGEVCWVGE